MAHGMLIVLPTHSMAGLTHHQQMHAHAALAAASAVTCEVQTELQAPEGRARLQTIHRPTPACASGTSHNGSNIKMNIDIIILST